MDEKLAQAKHEVNSSGSWSAELADAKVGLMSLDALNDVYQRRRDFLKGLVEKEQAKRGRGAQKRVAEFLEMDPSHLSQIITGHRQCGEDVAAKVCRILKKPLGYMDSDHSSTQVYSPKEPSNLGKLPSSSEDTSPPVVAGAKWDELPPTVRALIETVISKSSSGELADADITLVLSTISRLSSKE